MLGLGNSFRGVAYKAVAIALAATFTATSVLGAGKKDSAAPDAGNTPPAPTAPAEAGTSSKVPRDYSESEAKKESRKKGVMHVGTGIDVGSVKETAEIAGEQGCLFVILPGGPEGKVKVYIRGISAGEYDQNMIDGGILGANAIDAYKRRFAAEASASVARADPSPSGGGH